MCNYSSMCCYVQVQILVSHCEGRTQRVKTKELRKIFGPKRTEIMTVEEMRWQGKSVSSITIFKKIQREMGKVS